ncbi:MAG TPA: putative metalloprotease CJM1_0395 family protein [Rhodocyclaceae bacterium]
MEIGSATFARIGPLAPQERGGLRADARQTEATGQTPAEARQIAELRRIDQRVRAHEFAHLSAGAGVVSGGARYQYTVGPDGQRYATGGEVPIDGSPGRTPEETLAKAQKIRRAALAPVDPSNTDRRVAAQAAAMEAEARAQIQTLAREEATAGSEVSQTSDDDGRLSLYRAVETGENAPATFQASA